MSQLTRRVFLHAAAAATLAPGALAGTARRRSPNDTIPIAIIGMGIRGRNIWRTYLKNNDRVRVVAICEVDRTRRDHYKGVIDARYGNTDCRAYNADDDLLDRDDIAAVIIATPDHWHVTQCLKACAKGKDIYCEKPLTHTLHEGRVLIERVRDAGVVFQTGSQQRSEYGHKFVRAVELVRAGAIGKLITVNVGVGHPPKACDLPAEAQEAGLDWDRWLGPAPVRPYHSDLSPRGVHDHYPAWRRYSEYSGGYFADMAAHHYDIAQWGMGMDTSGPIEAAPPRDGDGGRGATLHYANGVTLTHGGPNGTTFIGTTGMIHVDRGRLHAVPAGILETKLEPAQTLPRHASHMDNWLDCIESREDPICGAEVGARTAAACQLVNMTYRLNRPLRWDPKAWRFIDDGGANALLDYERRQPYVLPG